MCFDVAVEMCRVSIFCRVARLLIETILPVLITLNPIQMKVIVSVDLGAMNLKAGFG